MLGHRVNTVIPWTGGAFPGFKTSDNERQVPDRKKLNKRMDLVHLQRLILTRLCIDGERDTASDGAETVYVFFAALR